MTSFKRLTSLSTLTLLALTLTACSNDDSVTTPVVDNESDTQNDPQPNDDATGLTSLSIDATAGGFSALAGDPSNKWAYLDLDTGIVLDLDDAAAENSEDWEIAFKRVTVKLNGGVSGSGSISAGIADAQLDFYDADNNPIVDTFVSASADAELTAITRPVELEQIDFTEDKEISSIVGDGVELEASWWIYDPAARSIAANPSVRYAVRGANGDSFAIIRVTDIQQAERQISLELNLQNPDEQRFSEAPITWVASIGAAGGTLCFDFDTQQPIDCTESSEDWDLQVDVSPEGRTWTLWTNGGVRGDGGAGASFGPLTESMVTAFNNGNDIPVWTEDTSGGVFDDYSWYAYNLREENRIWPNYRVYAITNGDSAWKFQILRYYDEAGTSGMLGVRYGQITPGVSQ